MDTGWLSQGCLRAAAGGCRAAGVAGDEEGGGRDRGDEAGGEDDVGEGVHSDGVSSAKKVFW